jgi:transcriptional regulator with XRE-family HTH domain
MNQWTLAQRLGVSQATVSYWEIGRREIPQDMIPKIMATLGIHEKMKAARSRKNEDINQKNSNPAILSGDIPGHDRENRV